MAKIDMNADVLQDILAELGIEVKFNEIIHREEIADKHGILYGSEMPLETLVAYIVSKYGDEYKRCNTEKIQQYIHLISVRHPYNPILEKIRAYAIEDFDYIGEISHDIMKIPQSDALSHTLIFKFFLQAVALLQNDAEKPFGGDGLVVLNGAQGVGKSLFCDVMATDARYYRSISINPYQDETDMLSRANGIFIGEFAELEKSLKPNTLDFFKGFITANKDSYRPKYGRSTNDYIRRSAYIATCNTDTFLFDKTGNRRFWVIPCKEPFDVKRLVRCKNGEDDIFIKGYVQAFRYLQNNGLQAFRLTEAERELVEKRNNGYMCLTECESLLKSILLYSPFTEFTIDQLKATYSELRSYDNVKIGRTLSNRLMLPQKTHKVRRGDGKQTTERIYTNIIGLQYNA